MLGQLDGVVPDSPRPAGYEHVGAGQRLGVTAETVGGGQGGDAEARPELVGRAVGQGHRPYRRHHAVLGRRAVAVAKAAR